MDRGRPSRGGRGLKLWLRRRQAALSPLARGARIETFDAAVRSCGKRRPSRGGRGLKHSAAALFHARSGSPLARGARIETRLASRRQEAQGRPSRGGRGLKRESYPRRLFRVAPRAGARIETHRADWQAAGVAPRAGARIETSRRQSQRGSRWVAPRAGAWIETRVDTPTACWPRSPLARGARIETRSQDSRHE